MIAFASGYKAISWHNRWDDEGGMGGGMGGGGMEGGMGGGMMGGGEMMGGWVSEELLSCNLNLNWF